MSESLLPLAALLLGIALLATLFWPTAGLVWRQRRRSADQERIQVEDALKYLYRCEREQITPSLVGLAGRVQLSENQAAALLQTLQEHGFVSMAGNRIALTGDGRAYSLHIVRAHRLWERHLADETGYAEHEWHKRAEEAEHHLTRAQADALASRMNNPLLDPHGDPIPTGTGEMVGDHGRPLTVLAAGQHGRISHLEDEPDALYAQLVAEGFYPGLIVQMIEQTPQLVRLWADGNEHRLAPIAATQISVHPLAELESTLDEVPATTLAELEPPAVGRIVGLSPRCRGVERRRFLDLGFVPGTEIAAELVSPGGEPTAYRVRDTLIALRKNQARLIQIEPQPLEVKA